MTIYRGYTVEPIGTLWHVIDPQKKAVHVTESEGLAMDWVDAEWKKKRDKAESGNGGNEVK